MITKEIRVDHPRSWAQVNVAFPDWATAEHTAVTHLGPLLTAAEADGLITSWFFVRKVPCWRLRYVPGADAAQTQAYLHRHLAALKTSRQVDDVMTIVYEPEVHAFGGVDAMASAHHLFHRDSRALLAYLAGVQHRPAGGHRRELSIILCTALLRGAGLDWYEQGDVWARLADHREPSHQVPAPRRHALEVGLRTLMSVDTATLVRDGGALVFAADWVTAFDAAGRELADLAARGQLHRGLRAILTHHIVFAWNRAGVPYSTQAVMASAAKAVVFGDDPASLQPEPERVTA